MRMSVQEAGLRKALRGCTSACVGMVLLASACPWPVAAPMAAPVAATAAGSAPGGGVAPMERVTAGEAAAGEAPAWQHALSYLDTPRYQPGFTHFDWVDPRAPKGGRIQLAENGTWDSFNPILARGRPAAGLAFGGQNLLYDPLLEPSADELTTRYGRLAEAVAVAADFSWVRFRLRAGARWHDGVPITAGDVVFAFDMVRAHGNPFLKSMYAQVGSAVAEDASTVRFDLAQGAPRNPSLALLLGDLYPLPAHWYRQRKFDSTLVTEAPLGSGPYRIAAWDVGRSVTYERVADYWGADLAVVRGRFNFDVVDYDYYIDRYALIASLKSGAVDARVEDAAKEWATGYDFAARHDGRFVREMLPVRPATGGGYAGFVFNLRLPRFQDVRVREALWWARDFDWANRVLLYDFYQPTESFFSDTPLAQRGLPDARERELLGGFIDAVPRRVLEAEYRAPRSSTGLPVRDALARADRLLRDAGWAVRDGVRVDAATGEVFRIDFLYSNPLAERLARPYLKNLARLGFAVSARAVEGTQYLQRMRNFDFVATVRNFGQNAVPNAELRNQFGSAAAAQPYSLNWSGIDDPVVDHLIEAVVGAADMPTLVAATRMLDRILLWNFYVVPGFRPAGVPMVYWNRFGRPRTTGTYRTGFPDTWWYDAAQAARAGLALDGAAASGGAASGGMQAAR
jgi:microcin C transport system substrate-binding protein